MSKVYSIIGLGKLGASMTAGIASRGYRVIGVDVIAENVKQVNYGHAPVQETDLEKTIQENKERISATVDCRSAVENSDVSFVIVPTPSLRNGSFSLEYAKEAFKEIGKALKDKEEYHLVVLTSTVLPGATRYGLLPILEKESGKKCGEDFGLCYSPEFIALGSIIKNFLNPDFNLVGEFDKKAGDLLEECYKELMENNAPCKRMTIENAELTKIAVNTFVTAKITFANMVANLCSQLPDGDIDVVSDALGCDKRIGRKYLTGGLGYGGTCFPRDNRAFGFIADYLDCEHGISRATDELNDRLTERIAEEIETVVDYDSVVAILGLSFKPYSHVIEESQSIKLAEALIKKGYTVLGYDPLVKLPEDSKITQMDNALDCVAHADVVIIANSDPLFEDLRATDFKQGAFVYDCWRLLRNKLENATNITYMALGIDNYKKHSEMALKRLWQ